MLPVLSRAQSRALDQHAIEVCNVPGLILMENAGAEAARILAKSIEPDDTVLVVCGKGNNGGDGFVVARHLYGLGFDVHVALLCTIEALTGDAAVNALAWRGIGGECREFESDADFETILLSSDIIVDAIFGTGLTRTISGYIAEIIELLNNSDRPIFSLDLPSGLDADDGRIHGICVHAVQTITFAHRKLGLYSTNGKRFAGQLCIASIGVPTELSVEVGHSAWTVDEADVAEMLEQLPEPAHKGEAGKVLVIAGSNGMLGAARLVAHAAARAGAGLVRIATFEEAAKQLQATTWEATTQELNTKDAVQSAEASIAWADVIVIGPGFGDSPAAGQIIEHVLLNVTKPVVADADALTHFSQRALALQRSKASLLLTPHPAEAARLLGLKTEEIEANRFAAIRQLATQSGATVLLKGVNTLISSPLFYDSLPRVNTGGNSALAAAGSGDVLAGLLGALCCHLPVAEAALCGAWLHGNCAERWRTRFGHRGMQARELADQLPLAMTPPAVVVAPEK